jgi:hypothetical protein
MADRIDKIIVEKEDSVRIYTLCAIVVRNLKRDQKRGWLQEICNYLLLLIKIVVEDGK